MLWLLGRHGPAEERFVASRGLYEEALGSDDPAVATVLDGHAELLRRARRTDEADELTRQAEAIRGGR